MRNYAYKDMFGRVRTFNVDSHFLQVKEVSEGFVAEITIPYKDIFSVTSNLVDGAVCIRYFTSYGVSAYGFNFDSYKHRDLIERLVNDILFMADMELNF